MSSQADKHMKQLQEAYQAMQQNFQTIQRLMPLVEAQLTSQMGGVGATLEKASPQEIDFRARVKRQFSKTIKK